MKKLFTFFALTVMGFVAAFAAGEEATETAKATIIVNTGEKYEEEPVEGAIVTFQGQQQTTPENGTVVFEGLNVDDVLGKTIAFTAYKDGYEPFEGEVDFTEGYEGYGIATLTPSEVTLTFKVTDADYEPIEGATVYFQEEGYITDEKGETTVTGLNGPEVIGKEFPFSAYKDGYVFYEGVAIIDMLEAQKWVQLEAAEVTLTFKVTDADYEPIEGATVYFQEEEYITDEKGETTVTGLNGPEVIGKEFSFSAYKDGYEWLDGVVLIDMLEAQKWVQLEAAEATLTVKVMDGEDPVAGATVTFNGEEYTSDGNGEVKITGINGPDVFGKTFPVTVKKDGYKTFEGKAAFTDILDAFVIANLEKIQSSINDILADPENSDIKVYDLKGRRTVHPKNGEIYIINGQKVLLNR